ncbi:hypothetical protein [Achromobacter xylosoxidans]|uniref:hypothetical protein n=1 Tax=Alcaligenes xylosoxydans xylosoxydans TaxID=85698 RepID=UPI001567572E|nr:hypothetical protein [Achromobacter xylosoxidans]QKI69219.1 hypothetical protein HPS44_06050 [Achromobacter xylosoxidans]
MSERQAVTLAELERQHAEALCQAEKHTRRYEELKVMTDEELAEARAALIARAAAAWATWGHTERAYAVQDILRFEAVEQRRAIEGEQTAGRDPYASGGALDFAFEIHGPHLPVRSSILERAMWEWRKYQPLSPLLTSEALFEFHSAAEREREWLAKA